MLLTSRDIINSHVILSAEKKLFVFRHMFHDPKIFFSTPLRRAIIYH